MSSLGFTDFRGLLKHLNGCKTPTESLFSLLLPILVPFTSCSSSPSASPRPTGSSCFFWSHELLQREFMAPTDKLSRYCSRLKSLTCSKSFPSIGQLMSEGKTRNEYRTLKRRMCNAWQSKLFEIISLR